MAKIGFIGMGNMGYAIAKGLVNKNQSDIVFHDNAKERMDSVSKELNISAVETNGGVLADAKYVVLAIKPQMLDDVLSEVVSKVNEEHVFISLCPGITIDYLSEKLNTKKIVRTMPNTPALVGEGMTGVSYKNGTLNDEEQAVVEEIFNAIGKMGLIDEKYMNAVVCASGSSPAYVFMFMEALADSVVKYGMTRKDAYKFVAQTVLGSAKLMLETEKHPGELKDMVCSPAGTTIAAVEALEKAGLRASLFDATTACYEKVTSMK
ncbi:MAG: pyrroline-5-carboxylate reductase [Eubacterium sp.]|nr:pyrroline-5-carboxylate reductase [Eubacterium sp.]